MDFDDRPEPAKNLQKARESAGYKTAREAALRFGWSYDSYLQHENGTRGIVRAAGKYAKAFKVSEAWLLTGEGRGPGESLGIDAQLELLLPPDDAGELRSQFEALIRHRRNMLDQRQR